MPPPTTLNATAHAALVLLSFGPASGYELKQRGERTLRFFFAAPAMSQIYTELDRLTAAGLVAASLEQRSETGDRETKVFALTAAGRRRLTRWLADDPLPTTVFKSHLALRMVVGHLAEPERMRELIRIERGRVEADRDDLAEVHDMLDATHRELGWAWLVAEWGGRYYRDALAQLDAMETDLDALVASHGSART